MNKYFLILFSIFICTENILPQKSDSLKVAYFAYLIDTTYAYYSNSSTLHKPFEIIIDESDYYTKNGWDFWEFYIDKLIEKYSFYNETAVTIYGYNDSFKELTSLRFNSKLYISTTTGVYKGLVSGYYFQDADGIEPKTAYTLLKAEDAFYQDNKIDDYSYNGKKFNDRILLVSDNKKISKIYIIEEDDVSLYKYVFKIIKKYIDGLTYEYSEFFTPSKEIKIFKGHYTNNKDLQFLVSCKYETAKRTYTTGIFLMDENGKLIQFIYDFTNSSDIKDESTISCHYAVGTVDIDGDGVDEIITRAETFDFGQYELLRYMNDDFYIIATGFSGRNY